LSRDELNTEVRSDEATTNQYVYPSNPFSAGQGLSVKVDPEDPSQVPIFGGG
jgi:hypothetical protein